MNTHADIVDPLPARANLLRIDNALIYTADPERPIVRGSVMVADGIIAAVGTGAEVDAVQVSRFAQTPVSSAIDGEGLMVMPGLVNAHWHSVSAGRQILSPSDVDDRHDDPPASSHGGDIPVVAAMLQGMAGLTSAVPPEIGQIGALQSFVWQLKSGATTVGDFGSLAATDALISAATSSGIRAALGTLGIDGVTTSAGFDRMVDTDAQLQTIELEISKVVAADCDRLSPLPSVLTAMAASDELLAGVRGIAERFDAPVATHMAAYENEDAASRATFGAGTVDRYAAAGLLSPRLIAAHTGYLSTSDAEHVVRSGVHLTHSPARYGAQGESSLLQRATVIDLIRSGAPVGLSTDSDDGHGGMSEAMRYAWLSYNEAAADPTFLPPTSILKMASTAGAAALGLADAVGMIRSGMKADLVAVRTDDWRYTGFSRPLSVFLNMGGSNDIDLVIVDGRVLVRDGAFTFLDEEALRCRYVEASQAFAAALRP